VTPSQASQATVQHALHNLKYASYLIQQATESQQGKGPVVCQGTQDQAAMRETAFLFGSRSGQLAAPEDSEYLLRCARRAGLTAGAGRPSHSESTPGPATGRSDPRGAADAAPTGP
jgi:hypothetical protein